MNCLCIKFRNKERESERERESKTPVDLPVLLKITAAYQLWHGFLPQIPRLTRYSLGEKINQLFIEIIELTLVATYASKERKFEIVKKASVKLDTLKYFLQIAWNIKAINTKRFTALTSPISEAGRMFGGWKKQLQKETPLL